MRNRPDLAVRRQIEMLIDRVTDWLSEARVKWQNIGIDLMSTNFPRHKTAQLNGNIFYS